MANIEATVAQDAIKQYQIAKRNGSPADACAYATMVSAAFLQAKDEASYKQWKDVEKSDCAAAGVPQ
ncbi:hypothetical protein ACO0K2_17945 [Undibacterium sp. MH2W]|uniref:hypothetical protein n=1 Tax=Undibacterium sp. MH2W TaxID=3413044 RepID=UPI003BF2C0BD